MSTSPEFRSLCRLADTAPTARVLNLGHISRNRDGDVPPNLRLFGSAMLDRCIILKHRLRSNEQELFTNCRGLATKVLIPVDPEDLSVGAINIFVGERNWRSMLAGSVDFSHLDDGGERDFEVLQALDAIPSLDPFLAREQLASRGIVADSTYFHISDNDLRLMSEFVVSQIVPLVALCLGNTLVTSAETQKLADKLLKAELDETMEPLRLTLRLAPEQFREGIFCWKGFLYYKWVLASQLGNASSIANSLKDVRYSGNATTEEKIYLSNARARLPAAIMRSVGCVRTMLKEYDSAFRELTEAANPVSFRDFLLNAPAVFSRVGDQLGALQHVISFWLYRRPRSATATNMSAPELVDILRDFELSIGGSEQRMQRSAEAA